MNEFPKTRKYDCPKCEAELDIPVSGGWPVTYGSESEHKCPGCGISLWMHGDEGSGDTMMFWLSTKQFPKLMFE
jgi:hypothetical protein